MGEEKEGEPAVEGVDSAEGIGIIQKSSKQEFIGRDMKFHGKERPRQTAVAFALL